MTNEPQILPPSWDDDRFIKPTTRELVEAGPLLPPIGRIPSGRWWVLIPGAGEANTMVNDHQLYWPRGVWFVIEDRHFHALMDTDYPMQWLDGWDLYEKVITTRKPPSRTGREFRVIESRLVRESVAPLEDHVINGRQRALPKFP